MNMLFFSEKVRSRVSKNCQLIPKIKLITTNKILTEVGI